MRGTSVWLSLVLLALLQIAASEDVVCKKGKTKKKIVLGPGESFSFSTDGDQYAAKMKCNANYKLSKKCKEAKISCSEFDTVAKGESCKGDFLMVKIGRKKMKYCGSNAPDMTTKAKKFTLMFSSNKKKSAAGVQCTVQCNDPAPIGGTTTEGPGTTTVPLNLECRDYKVMDDVRRSVNNGNGTKPSTVPYKCDSDRFAQYLAPDWKGTGWYRMMSPAGAVIPETSPGKWYCGTYCPGYMQGTHPTTPGQTKDVQFCFDCSVGSQYSSCSEPRQGKVTNCGDFYVYYLEKVGCIRRYCAAPSL